MVFAKMYAALYSLHGKLAGFEAFRYLLVVHNLNL